MRNRRACASITSHLTGIYRGSELSDHEPNRVLESKVPAATLSFWVLKLIATTVGEIAGNLVSMSWLGETTARAGQSGVNGYFVGSAMFGAALIITVILQVRARRFHPWLYWVTIVASTTFGTTLADFSTRSLGIGYTGGSLLLLGLVLLSLFVWKVDAGRVSADVITNRSSGPTNAAKKSRNSPLLFSTISRSSSCTSVLNTMGLTPSSCAARSILRTASSALSTLDTNGRVTGRNSRPPNWVRRLWPMVSAVTPV